MKWNTLSRKAIGVCMAVLLPMLAHAEEWSHKKKMTFNTTADGVEIKEDVAQLPLLVRLHSGNFTFAEAKPDGTDLRFFAADGKTPLKYHVENFDAANELANVWIALPKLAANAKSDSIVAVWGNANAPAAVDVRGTYDATQVFVYHFAKVDAISDAMGNNNASAIGLKAVTDGPIGAASSFDGKARLDIPASASLNLLSSKGFTFSAWIKPAADGVGTIYEQRDRTSYLTIGLKAGVLYLTTPAGSAVATTSLKPAVWQHIAVVGDAGRAIFYLDGKDVGAGGITLPDVAGAATIGTGLVAEIDEVTLSATARSPAYITALAASQGADALLVEFAEGEAGGGEGISYVSILLGAVTVDGWVIIGLLGVMLLISIYVMFTKTRMVLAALKANRVFLAVFAANDKELLTPGHEEVGKLADNPLLKKHSSLYRLYDVGLHEVTKRFSAQAAADKPQNLNGSALGAIRASLDAASVREGQRLNDGMVLLTIAIAGGPYLGLLGTVVGVMITFAAIAAAGDVNVNAIAPGIAAALVATVAGLAVAIPSLFGYNWLASKIKSVSSDTQVFVDEFMTKSAELHSPL